MAFEGMGLFEFVISLGAQGQKDQSSAAKEAAKKRGFLMISGASLAAH